MTAGLQSQCRAAGLDASGDFWLADESEIEAIYNGAGPDHFEPWQTKLIVLLTGTSTPDADLRKILTDLLSLFELSFVIHDWDFAHSDGSLRGFQEVTRRVSVNMKKELDSAYPFWKFWQWRQRSLWYGEMEIVIAAVSSHQAFTDWIRANQVAAEFRRK